MTMLTGKGIDLAHWAALRGAVRLEKVGLRHSSGKSMKALAAKQLGLRPRAPYDEVIAAIQAKIEEVKSQLGPDDVRG